jgi:hypothetical protein
MTVGPDPHLMPLPAALLGVEGLTPAATDALWRANAAEGWQPGAAALCPPSHQLADELIASPPGTPGIAALAAALRDPQCLHDTVVAHRTPPVWEAAAQNPSLSPATSDMMAADPAGVVLVSNRRAARQALTDAETAGAASAATVAAALINALEAVTIADLLVADARGTLTGVRSAVAAELARILVDDVVWGEAGATRRRVRDRVLELVPGAVRRELGADIAREEGAPLTAVSLAAAAQAVNAGELQLDEIAATLDAEAVAYAHLVGGTPAGFLPRPKPTKRPTAPKRDELGRHDSAADEAALMEALGMASVGSRSRLNSTDVCSPQALATALDAADTDTVIDWAEGRLPQRPSAGAVEQEMGRMALTRLRSLAAEVARRPDPLTMCPELIVVYPGAAAQRVDRKAARAAAIQLQRQLGSDTASWAVAARLLADAAEETLVELAAAATSVVAAPAV